MSLLLIDTAFFVGGIPSLVSHRLFMRGVLSIAREILDTVLERSKMPLVVIDMQDRCFDVAVLHVRDAQCSQPFSAGSVCHPKHHYTNRVWKQQKPRIDVFQLASRISFFVLRCKLKEERGHLGNDRSWELGPYRRYHPKSLAFVELESILAR
jgi:hypothetical protein